MADLTITIRAKEFSNKPVPVYIRVAHNSKIGYIKTPLVVFKSGVDEYINRMGLLSYTVTDPRVLIQCNQILKKYWDMIMSVDVTDISCSDLVNILKYDKDTTLSFTEFSTIFFKKMVSEGRERSSANYRSAFHSFQNFIGEKNISFKQITSKMVQNWIESLSGTSRAKNMYPTYLGRIFKSGIEHYNDYDNNIIRITNDPFKHIKIPQEDAPAKRGENSSTIRTFFEQIPQSPRLSTHSAREFLGYDVARMIFGLAGINTADLYDLEKSAFDGEVLRYNRKKTRDHRKNKAYMEIKVSKSIKALFLKYKGKRKLLNFSENYSTESGFTSSVSSGIKQICERAGLPPMTSYCFRHSWASIAVNECKASVDDTAFSLNHVSAHGVTWRYIKEDYSKIDKLNKKVNDLVFKKKEDPFK